MENVIVSICLQCRREFAYNKSTRDRKYCCRSCAGRAASPFVKGHNIRVPMEKRGHTDETKAKIKETCLKNRLFGKDNKNYSGATMELSRRISTLNEYKAWRKAVFDRDKYLCIDCAHKGYIEAHHLFTLNNLIKKYEIESYLDVIPIKEFWDINNGVTLCRNCHLKRHNRKNKNSK